MKILLVVTSVAVHLKMVEKLLMKRTWTAMAHCASHVKQSYSFVYDLNICQNNMMHKTFFEPAYI